MRANRLHMIAMGLLVPALFALLLGGILLVHIATLNHESPAPNGPEEATTHVEAPTAP